MPNEKSLLAELCDVTFIKDFFSDLSLFYDGKAVAKRKQEWKNQILGSGLDL